VTRVGVNILLVGLLVVGFGGAGYLLPFLIPINAELFDTVVLFCWGIGAALVLAGAVVAGCGRVVSRR
jgi:hypothetical protein